jgi:hypothetical protein
VQGVEPDANTCRASARACTHLGLFTTSVEALMREQSCAWLLQEGSLRPTSQGVRVEHPPPPDQLPSGTRLPAVINYNGARLPIKAIAKQGIAGGWYLHGTCVANWLQVRVGVLGSRVSPGPGQVHSCDPQCSLQQKHLPRRAVQHLPVVLCTLTTAHLLCLYCRKMLLCVPEVHVRSGMLYCHMRCVPPMLCRTCCRSASAL